MTVFEMLARGQKLRTALSLVQMEGEPERRSRQPFENLKKIIYSQTRANYVAIRSLFALAMPYIRILFAFRAVTRNLLY